MFRRHWHCLAARWGGRKISPNNQNRRQLRDPLERRMDGTKAMLVDVALIYCTVFGPGASLQYFTHLHIGPELTLRLLHGPCRRRPLGD
jgi:hypothetical protein